MSKELLLPKRKIHVLQIVKAVLMAHGKVLWSAENLLNILHDEGEMAILSAYFATTMTDYGATPANLYLGLDARASLAEDDTLSDLSGEPSGNGYARIALSTAGTGVAGQDFVIAQPVAAYQAASKTVRFTANGGNWGTVSRLFLCTAASGTSGKLISTVDLTSALPMNNTYNLDVSIDVGLAEPA